MLDEAASIGNRPHSPALDIRRQCAGETTPDSWPEYLPEFERVVTRGHIDVEDIFGMHHGLTPFKTMDPALGTCLKAN